MAKSRVACASFNIGTNTTITITRDVKTYTHTITYKFGNATGTIATKTASTSVVWSPNVSTLYAQIPNSVNGYGTITCETFNGNTSLGTTSAGFYAYTVKSECLPTVTATIVDTNESTIALTGNSSKLICYISKPKVTIEAVAKNSATIKTYNIYNPVGLTATTSTYTFDTVYSKEFRCTATDSRGYSTTQNYEVGFVEYYPIYFSEMPTIKRTESTSTTATLTIKGDCFRGNFGTADNTLTVKYRYKTASGNYGNYVTVNPTWNTDGTFTATINITNLSLTETYTFEVIAQDKLTSFGDGEDIILSQGMGDVRITGYNVQTKNYVVIGDKNNTDWKGLISKRKFGDVTYDSLIGAGNIGSDPVTSIELKQSQSVLGRFDIRKDGYLYNYLTNMSVAEIMSTLPSITAGGSQGYFLLNGGESATPVLVQWGRVSVTPATANAVTKQAVIFSHPFSSNPFVCSDQATADPVNVSSNVGDISKNGFNIYLHRTNTTATSVLWLAIGDGTISLPE